VQDGLSARLEFVEICTGSVGEVFILRTPEVRSWIETGVCGVVFPGTRSNEAITEQAASRSQHRLDSGSGTAEGRSPPGAAAVGEGRERDNGTRPPRQRRPRDRRP
jgi:hypothetical protein